MIVSDIYLVTVSRMTQDKYQKSPFRIPLRNKAKEIVDYTLVDEEDFERVVQHRWHLSQGYACGHVDQNL